MNGSIASSPHFPIVAFAFALLLLLLAWKFGIEGLIE